MFMVNVAIERFCGFNTNVKVWIVKNVSSNNVIKIASSTETIINV